jgi:hypothetical protein
MNRARLLLVAAALCISLGATTIVAQTQTPAANPPLGLVANAVKARVGNSELTNGSTIYTGDYVSTEDGGDVLIRIGSMSLELQSGSAAHLYRAPYGAVVELNHGSATYMTPGNHGNIVVVASDVRVTPELSLADFGRVSLDDPCNVTVSSQRGQVHVQVGNESRDVEEGKAYRVRAENSINYRKYLSPDESDYHDYHQHRPCAPVEMVKGRPPIAAGQSRFLLVAAVVTGGLTTFGVYKAIESADRP